MQVAVTPRARTEAETLFAPEVAATVCAELATVDLPLIANNGERVHLAVLKLSRGDLVAFRRHLALARTDWRDTLVAAGI
ncbi:MAG: hypothetical protein KF715_07120 [Candidatus Didemnitutus sp.]|nr:hypothetical protein [Candidatus Didemnitutus sp.]